MKPNWIVYFSGFFGFKVFMVLSHIQHLLHNHKRNLQFKNISFSHTLNAPVVRTFRKVIAATVTLK